VPASKEELSEQLSLTAKIAAQMERMADAAEKQQKAYESQVETIQRIASIFDKIKADDAVTAITNFSKAVKDASKQSQEFNTMTAEGLRKLASSITDTDKAIKALPDSMSQFAMGIKQVGDGEYLTGLVTMLGKTGKGLTKGATSIQTFMKSIQKISTPILVGSAALAGLVKGFSNLGAMTKSVVGFLASVVDGLANITISILAIPLKIFQGLVDMAAKAMGGSNELAEAIEKLRKQFGSLGGPTNKTIIDVSKSLKGFEATGLSAFRVFGTLAERLNYLNELATEMGASFLLLRKEMNENGGSILAYQKGLGLNAEQMKAVTLRANMMGVKTEKVLRDMTKMSYGLGESFDDNAKVISREMGEAMKDVAHFGTTSVKSLGESVTFAHKFGLELKDITGTLDTFSSFDEAAEHCANLSQAFGVNIDSFEMMKASAEGDVGKATEILRKSFKSAGIDSRNFTAVERKLIAQNTGLSDSAIQAAFSMSKQSTSLKDVQKAGDKAAKKTMTQEEAMAKLSDAIERLVKSGGGSMGGFWDQFFSGIKAGIMSTREFYGLMRNIQIALRQVYMIGVKLGRELVHIVPGMSDMLGGLRDFFKAGKFSQMFRSISDTVRMFFDPKSSDKGSVPKLFEGLKKTVTDMFTREGSAGRKILDGFSTFMLSFSKIAGDVLKYLSDQMAEGIKYIVDLLQGRATLNLGGAGAAAQGGLGFLGRVIAPIGEALKHAWNVLKDPLWELVQTLYKKLADFITSPQAMKIVRPALLGIGALLFGPAIVGAIAAAMLSGIVKGIGSIFTGGGATRAIEKKIGELSGSINKMTQEVSGKAVVKNPLPSSDVAGDVAKSAEAMSKAENRINWGKTLQFLLGLAGVVAIGMVATLVALRNVKGESREDIMKALAVVAAASASMLLAAGPVALFSYLKVDWKSAGIGILAMGTAVGLMAAAIAGVTWALKGIDAGRLKDMASIMIEMSKVFLMSGAVVVEAMLIGAVLYATGGTGALVALGGFAIMGAAVAAMAGSAMVIMKALDAMQVGTGFKEKVDAFTSIMNAITEFSKNITSMLSAVTPSWLSILRSGDDTKERIGSLTKFLEAFIGKPGGAGLIGLVEKIIYAVQSLAGGDSKALEAAQVFGTLLTAVTGLAMALKPPDKMFDAINGLLTTPVDVQNVLAQMTEYTFNMSHQIQQLIKVIITNVMPLASQGMSDNQVKAAQVIGSLLSAVVALAQALTPSPALMNQLRDVTGSSWFRGEDSKINPENLKLLGTFISTMSDSMQKILPDVISSLDPLLKAIGGWHFSDSDANTIKFIGPLLQQLILMVQSVTSQSVELAKAKIPGLDIKTFVDKIGEVMPKIFQSFADKLPLLFDSLKKGINSLSTGIKPEALKQGIEAFKGIVSVLTSIPQLANDLSKVSDASAGIRVDKVSIGDLNGIVTSVADFFEKVTVGEVGKPASFKRLARYLANPAYNDLARSKGSIDVIKSVFQMLEEMPKAIGNFASAVGGTKVDGTVTGKLNDLVTNVAEFFDKATSGADSPFSRLARYLAPGSVFAELAKSKGSINAIKSVFQMLEDVPKSISSFQAATGGVVVNSETTVDLTDLVIDITNFFQKMVEAPSLLSRLAKYLSNDAFKELIAAKGRISMVQTVFKALGELPDAIGSFVTSMGSTKIDSTSVGFITNIVDFFKNLTQGKGGATLMMLAVYLSDPIFDFFVKSKGSISTVVAAFKMLEEIPHAVGSFTAALGAEKIDSNASVDLVNRLGDVFDGIFAKNGPLSKVASSLKGSALADLIAQNASIQQLKVVDRMMLDLKEVLTNLIGTFVVLNSEQGGFTGMTRSIGTMIGQVDELNNAFGGNQIKQSFGKFQTNMNDLRDASQLLIESNTLSQVSDSLGIVVTQVVGLNSALGGGAAPKTFADFQMNMTALTSSLSTSDMSGTVDMLNGLGTTIGGMLLKGGAFDQLDKSLSITGSKNIESTISKLDAFNTNMTAVASILKGGTDKSGIVGALMAVSEMVKQANDLDKALSNGNVNKIDVKAKLERVAKSVGLGSKVSYTVNPSKEIQLTVNLLVTMNAGEVEKTLLSSKGSVIKDRLNGLTDGTHKNDTAPNIGDDGTAQVPTAWNMH